MNKLVNVRLAGKDYRIPYHNKSGWKLIRITNHPLEPNKLLTWRQETKGMLRNIAVYDAAKMGKSIKEEDIEIAGMRYDIFGENAAAGHFSVYPNMRRKSIGSALLKTVIRELKDAKVKYFFIPRHKDEKFYLSHGFEKVSEDPAVPWAGYKGDVKKLAKHVDWWGSRYQHGSLRGQARPKGLKVLWQRANPRFVESKRGKVQVRA